MGIAQIAMKPATSASRRSESMRQRKRTYHPAWIVRGKILIVSMVLAIVIGSSLLLISSSSAPLGHSSSLSGKPASSETIVTGDSFLWDGETENTAPTF